MSRPRHIGDGPVARLLADQKRFFDCSGRKIRVSNIDRHCPLHAASLASRVPSWFCAGKKSQFFSPGRIFHQQIKVGFTHRVRERRRGVHNDPQVHGGSSQDQRQAEPRCDGGRGAPQPVRVRGWRRSVMRNALPNANPRITPSNPNRTHRSCGLRPNACARPKLPYDPSVSPRTSPYPLPASHRERSRRRPERSPLPS